MAEPAAKRAKKEEEAEEAVAPMEEEEQKEEEAAKALQPEARKDDEAEEDSPADKSPKIKGCVTFLTKDTTMNVMPSSYGNILVPLTDGGLQYLLAGARASVGVKSGRYMYEVKVIENTSTAEDPQVKLKVGSRHVLKLGFSMDTASLLVGEGDQAVCFDSEGTLWIGKEQKKTVAKKFGSGDIVAVLLNLDASSANCLTVSLFVNGKRACMPQALPENLVGKTLFPCMTFKNVSVHYNFGPEQIEPLPFTCRMLQTASAADVLVKAAPAAGTKPEVLFPVFLPDEGTFDWLDMFLEEHPDYTELSDRAILRWAELSGLVRPKGYVARTCNDKPEYSFGIPTMDDGSIRKTLMSIAPIQARNYVIMEVRANLLKSERAELLARWTGAGFKITANVMMGDPPSRIKEHTHAILLKEKQAVSDADFKKKKDEEQKKREAAKKQKQLEKQRALVLKRQKKAAEKARKKLENERKRKEAEAKGEEFVEEEEPAEDDKEEEEKEEEEQPAAMDEEPPQVELSPEEKAQVYLKGSTKDLIDYAMNTSFPKFTIPTKDEGFDSVAFEWLKEAKCRAHLKDWVQAKKTTTRIEDLKPGDWFAEKSKDWQKILASWHAKSTSYKSGIAKKAAEKAAKQAKKVALKAQEERKKALEDKKAAAVAAEKAAAEKVAAAGKAAGEGEGEEVAVEAIPAKEAEPAEAKDAAMKEAEEEPEPEEDTSAFEKLDVYGVEEVLDALSGEPLFSRFGFEDWALMSLRAELHLLAHAFTRDVDDPDRGGMHLDHVGFYYQKYFKKPLNHKLYGVDTVEELMAFLRDTVVVSRKDKVLEPQVPDNFESQGIFIMLTEEARRDRLRRVDLGDDTAKLRMQQAGINGVAPLGTRSLAPVNPKASGPGAWQQPKPGWNQW